MEKTEFMRWFAANSPVVTTDSRVCPSGSVFVALKGASFDGNRFAAQALDKGCAVAVVDEPQYAVAGDSRFVVVDDALTAYKEMAREHRRRFRIPVIGITGTNGKTTTKELTAAVLSRKYRTLATEANFNNDVGVPKTLMRLASEHEMAVIEMGASHPGDIRKLVEYVEPTAGLITNVGRAHLQGFGSFEGVKKTKGELYDWLAAHGAAVFLNAANPNLVQMAHERGISRCVSYGQSDKAGTFDVTGRVVECNPYLKFQWESGITVAGHPAAGGTHTVQTRLIGAYNIDNALAAITVGLANGVPAADICAAIEAYQPTNDRSELVKTQDNTLVVDAYNANPSSMAAAIDNFRRITTPSPKLAILGDMRELGAASAEEHQRVVDSLAELAAKGDGMEVWLVGPEFGKTATTFRKFADEEAVAAALKTDKPRGRCILIKGSNGMHLAKLIPLL